jgi:hypothetical protein
MPSRVTPFVSSALAVLALIAACNGQGEGDECDPRNGNNDCRNGYVCTTPPPQFMGMRCCPSDTALATHPACQTGGGALDASAAPPDSSAAPADATATVDASAEPAPDAAATAIDGSSD